MNRRPDVYKPFPEIVEDEFQDSPYEIIDSTDIEGLPSEGMTDLVKRRILVPLHAGGKVTSRHEMAHVVWSPRYVPRVRYDRRVFLVVEDARINLGLEALGLPLLLSAADRSWVSQLAAQDLERGDPLMFVLRAIASLGTNALEAALWPADELDATQPRKLARHLVNWVRGRLEDGRDRAGGAVTSVQHALRIARELARKLEAAGYLRPGSSGSEAVVTGHGCGLCVGDSAHVESIEDPDLLRLRERLRDSGRDPAAGSLGDAPGRMFEVVAPLEVACARPRGGHGRDWRPTTEGSVVSYAHRHPIDGAIFRRRARRHGGTVLVDTSGSMSLDASGVERILRNAPWATLIAIYSGSGAVGELRIVARRGRRAGTAHLVPYGSGNIVDLPALEWLARQPAPRVWVSDGGVSGVGDRSYEQLRSQCKDVRRRARIRTVRTAEEAARVLERSA